jgi:hypothetical protein
MYRTKLSKVKEKILPEAREKQIIAIKVSSDFPLETVETIGIKMIHAKCKTKC